MIFMHLETAELYEVRIKSLGEPMTLNDGRTTWEIGFICLHGHQEPPTCKYSDMANKFEFLGWL